MLVDFWAEWCRPYRAVAPILDTMAGDLADKLDIVKVDVDANPVTAGRFEISSIPALVLFKQGEVVTRIVGAKPRGLLEKSSRRTCLGSRLTPRAVPENGVV